MGAYYSRKYIQEKWVALKRDIEGVLDIYGMGAETDGIPAEDVQRVRGDIKDKMLAILSELES